jgi:hypothetical protein
VHRDLLPIFGSTPRRSRGANELTGGARVGGPRPAPSDELGLQDPNLPDFHRFRGWEVATERPLPGFAGPPVRF